jgi:hypothetical protein
LDIIDINQQKIKANH